MYDGFIFSADALQRYRESDSLRSVHSFYTEVEQPPLDDDHAEQDYNLDQEDHDMMNLDSLLPRQGASKTANKNDNGVPPSTPPKKQIKVVVNEPPPAASVFKLFGFFSQDMVRSFSLPLSDVLETVRDRCPLVVQRDAEKRQAHMEKVVETFVMRMILEMFTVDDRGTKIRQILQELDETYLLKDPPRRVTSNGSGEKKQQPKRGIIVGGRGNFINADAVHKSTNKTYYESMSSDDAFYKACSNAKKRGRRPVSEKNKQTDRIDLIKASHILSQKSVAPVTYSEEDDKFYTMANCMAESLEGAATPVVTTGYGIQSPVDFYPVFRVCLKNFHACIPDPASNHGAFLATLNRAMRVLSPSEWPMHGLCKSLMNAELIFPLRKILVPGGGRSTAVTEDGMDVEGNSALTQYRCAYSGLALEPGEEVWHLRVLVYSGKRHRKWVLAGKLPPCPMTSRKFTRSIRAYFIKLSVVGPFSLFYDPHAVMAPPKKPAPIRVRPAEESVQMLSRVTKPLAGHKTQHPAMQSKSLLPPGRALCVNTLWVVLNQMRVFVAQSGLEKHVYGRWHPLIPYAAMVKQLVDIYETPVARDQVLVTFDACLCIGSLVSDMQYRVDVGQMMQDPDALAYIADLRDSVLDFVDLMFPFAGTMSATQQDRPTPLMKHSFSMPCFGIKHTEGSQTKIPGWATPQLADPDSQLLSVLLAESYDRRERRAVVNGGAGDPTYQEKRDRAERLESYLVAHPFVFIALFQVLFQPHPLPSTCRLSFKECHAHLRALGMYVNTDPRLSENNQQLFQSPL
jgi:hypothetical protein